MTESKQNTDKVLEHKNIYEALSAFQGDLKPIEKDSEVDFTTKGGEKVNFKYSSLGKIMETINPILGKHGLSVRWEIKEKGIECVATHKTTEDKLEVVRVSTVKGLKTETDNSPERETSESDIVVYGEIRSGLLPLDFTKPDMKEVGGQITYGRRYTLGLALGIATEEDKDAELQEKNRANTEKFAVSKIKENITKAKNVDDMLTQVEFLEKELQMAKDFEQGNSEKAPTLGLSSKQYEDLLEMARKKGNELNQNG